MKEVHLICNAHIDPIWQWDWPEGVSATLSTFQSAVKLAEEFDYIFCHNEVTVYKYVEEYAPALFARIRELVKRGKWHIMGGWYLQPDCNMPSGESFVRQILEGRRYFLEKFGVFPKTAVNFDPFGHTVGLVQIIKKCGQDSYMFMRPYDSEMALPAEQFLWRGLDGSEIKAVRTGNYNTALGEAAASIKRRAARKPEDICMVTWGVGNHGGGPSRKDLTDIKRLMAETGDTVYLHSTPERFFARVAPRDAVETSLRISMPGCYTSTYAVKKKHALLENELYLTEKMLSTAFAKGLLSTYPEEEIHTAVEDLLNAEFHDVLPGTSVACGEENGLRLLDHGLLTVERLKTRAYFALSAGCAVAGEGEYPFVVFNPHAHTVRENVVCEFSLADQNWSEVEHSAIVLLDENGAPVPYQIVKEESNLNLDWRKRIVFEATLSPFGLHRYSAFVKFEPAAKAAPRDRLVFDNGRKRVEIDAETGLLKTYTVDGVPYVENGFCPVMFRDNADPWAMGAAQLERVGTDEQPFAPSEQPDGVFAGMKRVQVIEDGDIYLGIEAFFEREHTRARVEYKIYKNNDYVDIDVDLFMGDIDRAIKLKMPVCREGRLVGQTAFGTEPLFTDARENVAHRFVAVQYGEKSLVLMNQGVYGSHYENGALYMSLVRGVTYCAHPIADRALIPTDRYTKKADQGLHRFSFRLGVTRTDLVERETALFVQKPYALNIFPTEEEPTLEKPFDVTLSDESVTVVTVKKADGREGLIFRLLNNTAHDVQTALSVNGACLPLHFGRYEVKTVLFENGALLEWAQLMI
ncbi:MAG: alpha-mannosidase [Clostridia bacterium]|nr:alpha-mannosidase [Clostridia bacterium]